MKILFRLKNFYQVMAKYCIHSNQVFGDTNRQVAIVVTENKCAAGSKPIKKIM